MFLPVASLPKSSVYTGYTRLDSSPNSTTSSEPTVFENYVHDIYVDEQLVELSLWDTAGAKFFSSTLLDVSDLQVVNLP